MYLLSRSPADLAFFSQVQSGPFTVTDHCAESPATYILNLHQGQSFPELLQEYSLNFPQCKFQSCNSLAQLQAILGIKKQVLAEVQSDLQIEEGNVQVFTLLQQPGRSMLQDHQEDLAVKQTQSHQELVEQSAIRHQFMAASHKSQSLIQDQQLIRQIGQSERAGNDERSPQDLLAEKVAIKRQLLINIRNVEQDIKQLRTEIATAKAESMPTKTYNNQNKAKLEQQRVRIEAAKTRQLRKQKLHLEELKAKEEQLLRLRDQRKEEKRLQIQRNLQEIERRKRIRLEHDRIANKVIVSLKAEQVKDTAAGTIAKSPGQKRNVAVRLQDIKEHERRYHQIQEYIRESSQAKRQQSRVQAKPVQFEKSVFTKIILDQEKHRKEEEKKTKEQLIYRLKIKQKYSQLVKETFKEVPRKAPTVEIEKASQDKPQRSLPPIPQPAKKKPRVSEILGLKEEDLQKRKRKAESLKRSKMSNLSEEKPQPKYKDYLAEMVKQNESKKQTYENWQKVLVNRELSAEAKYERVMQKVGNLENIAKRKEQQRGEELQLKAMDLYLQSINAKLALLQLKSGS